MIYFDFLKALFKDVKKSINQEIKEDKAVIKEIIALMVKTYHQDKQTIKEEISQSKLVRELDSVLDAYMKRDPAAKSKLEVLLLYPGVHAILAHRLAHKLHKQGYHFSARAISQLARFFTGIEIHPAATIGRRFFIDHGMGVVIGETAVVGDNCTIYQGVTLGGTGKDKGKRHPTIGNNVLIGCGAKVLGPFTVGDNSKIAANAVVLHEVPEDSTAVGIPAKVVRRGGVKIKNELLDHVHIPDPVAGEFARMERTIEELRAEIAELKSKQK
jgi:serine O-acetyltransferase